MCRLCGEHHTPNGTQLGDVCGVPMIVDCTVPAEFPYGLLVPGSVLSTD